MLSAANAQLVLREQQLTGLAVLLDPTAFAGAVHPLAGTVTSTDCRLLYLRYKPGRRCIALYSIAKGDGDVMIVAAQTSTVASSQTLYLGIVSSVSSTGGGTQLSTFSFISST